jgi:hypothetical protein
MRTVLAVATATLMMLLVPTERASAQAAAAPRPAAAAAVTQSPVAKDKLQGTRLIDADANFSIDAPAPDWQWSTLSIPGTSSRAIYAVDDPARTRRFLVLVSDMELRSLNRSVLAGMKAGLPNHGAGVEFEDVAVPAGGKRYHFDIQASDGTQQHCVAYVVATGRPVTLENCSEAGGEAPEMHAWVASFQTLHEVQPAVDNSLMPMAQYLVALFAVVGIGALINKAMGRLAVDGWKLGGIIVILLAIVEGVALVLKIRAAALSDIQQGEAFGQFVINLLPALVLAVLGSRSLRRRRAERQAAASAATGPQPRR